MLVTAFIPQTEAILGSAFTVIFNQSPRVNNMGKVSDPSFCTLTD